MANTDKDQKTEAATGKRRGEFRDKGQVAQSKEVNTAALMTTTLLLWLFYGPVFWEDLSTFVAGFLSLSGEYQVTQQSIVYLAVFVTQAMFKMLTPFLILAMVVGFLASYLQIGWIFSTQPFMPDIAKFNPIKGMGKFFSKKSMLEVVKSLAKVGLVGFVAYKTVKNEFEGALYLVDMDVSEAIRYLAHVGMLVLAKSCAIFIALAAIDFYFQRHDMEEQMKMTKQEVKEEHRDIEGDPQIKSKRRSIQMQRARQRMMAEVPKADVVITNPTHISVAIRYEKGEMEAPQVIAKGADHLALRIREIAKEHKIPIVENIFVARALHKIELGTAIPENLFKAVAEILAYVYKLKGKRL